MSSIGRIGLLIALGTFAGCSEGAREETRNRYPISDPAPGSAPAAELASTPGRTSAPEGTGASATPADSTRAIPRKIVYEADLQITVESFDRASDQIARLIREHGGYLADSNLSGRPGEVRSGRWKVRIPVGKFDTFVEKVVALGELQSRQTNSQDVTEEYYDLEARIKNKKIEETRLLKHLEESTGKLEEILAVEREVTRVRGEIEQGEGRLRLLTNLTELTTVTIHITERRRFEPSTAPDFKTRMAQTFQKSADRFTDFCKNLVLVIVSIIPWLPVWIVGLLVVWIIVRLVARVIRARVAAIRRPVT